MKSPETPLPEGVVGGGVSLPPVLCLKSRVVNTHLCLCVYDQTKIVSLCHGQLTANKRRFDHKRSAEMFSLV